MLRFSSKAKGSASDLYEFLTEAELCQYYHVITSQLKIQTTSQLKYVSEEDLLELGMTWPEVRRLKKCFGKHFPSSVFASIKSKLFSSAKGVGHGDVGHFSPMALSSCSCCNYSRVVTAGGHIIQKDAIVAHNTLGSGEFGTVKQGVWTDPRGSWIQVAIKSLSRGSIDNSPVEFLKEAAIMHALDHAHIVQLYGVVLEPASLMLVMELAPLRSLLECLKEPSMRINLDLPTLHDMSLQIARGMAYLESKRLIHRDLATRNILVFSQRKVKISDFGLSRALGVGTDYYQTNLNVNLKLPVAWCAPECIKFLRFTSASDIFAYGVTLWEIFSYGFEPWAGLTGTQILEAIDVPNYQRLEKPEFCPRDVYFQIMLKCWQHDPSGRPKFVDLLTLLLDCKPELVQTIRESRSTNTRLEGEGRREWLEFEAGAVICVLDKQPALRSYSLSSEEAVMSLVWKGVLKDGRSGLFHSTDTIAYLCNVKKRTFTKNEVKPSSLPEKGRRTNRPTGVVSGPQDDGKTTGHVGRYGLFFGDSVHLGPKSSWVPRQIVLSYKTGGIASGSTSSEAYPYPHSSSKGLHEMRDFMASTSYTAPALSTASLLNNDDGGGIGTEYQEISDGENECVNRNHRKLGISNPALTTESQSPLQGPRFEVHPLFNLGSPIVKGHVFGPLQAAVASINVSKTKVATMKPISSSEPTFFGTETDMQLLQLARRVMGSSASDEDCQRVIQEIHDAAHVVKFLRLRGLIV